MCYPFLMNFLLFLSQLMSHTEFSVITPVFQDLQRYIGVSFIVALTSRTSRAVRRGRLSVIHPGSHAFRLRQSSVLLAFRSPLSQLASGQAPLMKLLFTWWASTTVLSSLCWQCPEVNLLIVSSDPRPQLPTMSTSTAMCSMNINTVIH